MKKLTILIFALVYISTSSGVLINKHYCMGELVNWSFTHDKNQNCTVCGMAEADSDFCCNDEKKFLRIDNDQHITAGENPSAITNAAFIPIDFFISTPVCISLLTDSPVRYNKNLLWQTVPLFISNCTFII